MEGFSVEEWTDPKYWWTDNAVRDPWAWREQISGKHKIAYGKFFDKKAGFVSLEWLPYFVNYRRDGYDLVTSAYKESPEASWQRLFEHVKELYEEVDDESVIRLIGKKTIDKGE